MGPAPIVPVARITGSPFLRAAPVSVFVIPDTTVRKIDSAKLADIAD
jgi:hypothetical protein